MKSAAIPRGPSPCPDNWQLAIWAFPDSVGKGPVNFECPGCDGFFRDNDRYQAAACPIAPLRIIITTDDQSAPLVDRFIDTKLLSSLTTPAILERAVAWCLEQGLLRRHAERVAGRLAASRSRVVRLAQDAGCRFVAEPQGLFGWVETGVDTEALAERLAAEGWLIAPGHLFFARPLPGTLMRVNFASAQDARFWRAFERAREALRQALISSARTDTAPLR